MDKVLDKELDKIIGGSSVSGTLLNAFTTIIKFIYEVGEGIGSSLRRIGEGDLCPLKWFFLRYF